MKRQRNVPMHKDNPDGSITDMPDTAHRHPGRALAGLGRNVD